VSSIPGKKNFFIITLFCIGIVLNANSIDFTSDLPPEELADALLNSMSDEEILAQTFMLGWVGADPSPLIVEWIQKRNIGGVKIFGWNTEDTLRLAKAVGTLQSTALQQRLKIPLLVATDQEGGWVRHVKGSTSETPGNMAIGASGFPQDAYLSGYYIGRELAALGINMNFAPSVDLFTNQHSTIIGPRSFGDNPVYAGILGTAFAKGLLQAGIIPTAKHYPGHGDTELDSHGILPSIPVSFSTLWDRELVPYRMLAKEHIPAIMSGHLAFPQTPGGYEPASLNSWFITEILRKKIGFTGVVITDDLLMNGATSTTGSVSKAAKKALQAGNDIIMISKTPNLNDSIWTSLLNAMKTEESFKLRVQEAARRVLILKLTCLKSSNAPAYIPDIDRIPELIPNHEGQHFSQQLAARSVTLLFDGGKQLPITSNNDSSILLAGQFKDFFSAGLKAFPGASTYCFSIEAPEQFYQEQQELQQKTKGVDTIIFLLADTYGAELAQSLRKSGKKVVIFSVLSPVYIPKVWWADAAIAVYSYSYESFVAGFSFLKGNIPAQGTIPFTLK
jgi:beta-N-acetylhexosaminidase